MTRMQGVRREGDAIQIAGDYQARALNSERIAQRFWHEAKFRLIQRVAMPGGSDRALDAGCGSGTISHFLSQTAAEVVGSDSNPAAIAYATRMYGSNNLKFVLGQFEDLIGYDRFDWIYCIEVIEHLYAEQGAEVLSLFRKLAKPGAHLLVTTPNYRSLWPVIEWFLDRLRLVPHLTEDQHVTSYCKSRLRALCENAGWTVVKLGSFNGFAPFAAFVSYAAALKLEAFEMQLGALLPNHLAFSVCRNDRPID